MQKSPVLLTKIVNKVNRMWSGVIERCFFVLKNNWIIDKWYRTPYCKGSVSRLHLGKNNSPVNTLFNTASGHIYIGDNTIFGHNVMVITGVHEFVNGKRKSLTTNGLEAPTEGYDIHIGNGCWISSGAIITGRVTIGDNVIIGAGAVVTRDIPSGVFAAGVPARIIKQL